jgi:hypothetical protein
MPNSEAMLDRLEVSEYQQLRAAGIDEATARVTARLSRVEFDKRVSEFLRQFRAFERHLDATEPPTLAPRWELVMWNFRDEDAAARIPEMRARGMSAEEITRAVYPLRWDLIARGRRDIRARVEYAEEMAAKAEAAGRQLPGAAADPPESRAGRPRPLRGRRRGSGLFESREQFRALVGAAVRRAPNRHDHPHAARGLRVHQPPGRSRPAEGAEAGSQDAGEVRRGLRLSVLAGIPGRGSVADRPPPRRCSFRAA